VFSSLVFGAGKRRLTTKDSKVHEGLTFAGFLMIGCAPKLRGKKTSKQPSRLCKWPKFLSLIAIAFLILISGCGGGSGNSGGGNRDPGTPAGTSTVTITATSGTLTHTTTLTLNVQ